MKNKIKKILLEKIKKEKEEIFKRMVLKIKFEKKISF
jgi:hypothetical protein